MYIHEPDRRRGRGACAPRSSSPIRWIAATALLVLPGLAAAQPADTSREVSATVVSRDGADLVVDLGSAAGARPGDVVELWRPLKLRHPVTKQWLEDRFRIGSLRLVQVGNKLTLAQPDGQPIRQPEPGDIVLLRTAPTTERLPAPTAEPTGAPAVVPSTPCTDPDPEAQTISAIFDSLRGADLVRRIRAYEDYVRANPEGRFSAVLYEEAQSLRRLLQASQSVAVEPIVISFRPPESLLSDTPVSFGFEASDAASGAVLHLRTVGETTYSSLPMAQVGPGYWAATVDGPRVRAPGLEYFIEATGKQGTAVPLVGEAQRPEKADVRELPRPVPPKHRDATFSVLTDYADYNRMRGDDYAWQTEGYFGLRYGDEGVRAIRSGFGVYRGAGGTIDDLDELGKEPRRIGLTYGYLELEYGVSPSVSFIGRGAVGLEDDGTAGGGQAMIRIGNDQSTNLMLGGEFLGGVGLRGFTQLELNIFERVPILLRSEVTNQPAGISDSDPRPTEEGVQAEDMSQDSGDLGARGIVQVGYRVLPSLTVAGRLSYQGRTIKHAGPGAGAAITYAW
jgi:hypothetical protein